MLTDLTGPEAPGEDSDHIEVSGGIFQKDLTLNSAAADNMKECCTVCGKIFATLHYKHHSFSSPHAFLDTS